MDAWRGDIYVWYAYQSRRKCIKKYGRDITNDVKTRKIDPVIGRDDEIRSITRNFI